MTAETVVNQIITNAQTTGEAAKAAALQYALEATTAATGFSSAGALLPPVHEPDVFIPPFDPDIDLTGDFLRGYDEAIGVYGPAFRDEVTDFINRFFPNTVLCLKTAVDSWICATLQTGGTGMQPDVENALWQRSRDREVLDARRVVDEAVSGFSARGWKLENGVLIDAVLLAEQAASDKASTHSRDVMIKQAEIEIENIRFAVTEGVKLRLGVISALVQFLAAWAKMYEIAIDKAKALLDAKIRLRESAGAYYTALIGAARLMLEYDKIRSDVHVALSDIDMREFGERNKAQVGAAVAAAEAMGALAAAALGSQNTLAEVAHNTQVSSES